MNKTISITVSGRVQGVFYRQTAKEKALSLGIKGYVENLDDGTVHVIATGGENALDQFITWCHEGPQRASVTAVNINHVAYEEYKGFTVKR